MSQGNLERPTTTVAFTFPSHNPSAPPRGVQQDRVVLLLAEGVGATLARSLVTSAARSLGLSRPDWTLAEALDVLDRVAQTPGRAGVAALFGKSRLILEQR